MYLGLKHAAAGLIQIRNVGPNMHLVLNHKLEILNEGAKNVFGSQTHGSGIDIYP